MDSFFRRQTAPTAETSIENYLGELSHELRWRLPEADTAEVVAEIKAHLQDQIDDRVTLGMPESDAVREAILGFGSPRAFARHTADGMTASHMASRSCIGLRIQAGIVIVLAASFTLSIGDSSLVPLYLNLLAHDQASVLRCLEFGTCAFLLAFLSLAFLSRRASTKYLLGCGAVLLASSVMAVGLYRSVLPDGQWADSRQLSNVLRYERHRITALGEDISLLRSGIAVYGSGSPRAIIGALKQGDRYIMPGATQITLYGITHDLTATESAFHPIARYEAQGASSFSVWYGKDKYATTASYGEARAQWEKYSTKWLWKSARQQQEARNRLRQYEALAQQAPSFRLDCLWWDDLWGIPFTAIIVLLDWLAASAGRHIALVNRRARRNQTA